MSTAKEIVLRQQEGERYRVALIERYCLGVVNPLMRRALLELSAQLAQDEIHAMIQRARRRINEMYEAAQKERRA